METHIINQIDIESNEFNWVAIDEQTARELWNTESLILYYVREDAEGLIEDEEDLELAILHNSVCIEDSYLWHSEYEELKTSQTFENWCIDKIKTYYPNNTVYNFDEVLNKAKAEILEDIKTKLVPRTVADFSELHDYVDANCYGGFCEENYEASKDYVFENSVQSALDEWLKNGRP